MDEENNCKNFEDSSCLCHKKFDCVNKRLDNIYKDVIDMSEEMNKEVSVTLRKNFVYRLKEMSNRNKLMEGFEE